MRGPFALLADLYLFTAGRQAASRAKREPEREGGAVAFLAPDRDVAPVRRGDVLDDGQPEPCASGRPRPRRVDPVEPLEEPLAVPLGYADALVSHADLS